MGYVIVVRTKRGSVPAGYSYQTIHVNTLSAADKIVKWIKALSDDARGGFRRDLCDVEIFEDS
jgi:hypothetical protein